MILEPTAKPVKFRIVCDGIEHSTIASLKKHFFITDIEERIKDESLKGFFRQQGIERFPDDAYQAADILFEAGGEIKDEESLLLWLRKHNKELFDKHLKKYLPSSFEDLEQLPNFNSKELKKDFGDIIYKKANQDKAHYQYPKMLEQAAKLGSSDAKKDFDQYKIEEEKRLKEEGEKKEREERAKPETALKELTRIVANSEVPTNYATLISQMRKYYDIYDKTKWKLIPNRDRELLQILLCSLAIGSGDLDILKKVILIVDGVPAEDRWDVRYCLAKCDTLVQNKLDDDSLRYDFKQLYIKSTGREPIYNIKPYLSHFMNKFK